VLIGSCWAALQATGGPESPLYPLAYVLVAFLVTFHRLSVGVPLVVLALLFELLVWRAAGLTAAGATTATGRLLLTHVLYLLFFAVVHTLFLQAELFRQRRAHRAELASELQRMREEARDFRLISSQLGPDSRTRTRAEEEEKLAQGAVETIHQGLYYHLELVKKALDLHTCVLLWLDEAGERLRIKELVSDAEGVAEGTLPLDAGVIAPVVKHRTAVSLIEPKPSHLPYYVAGAPVSIVEFLAVPVLEGEHLRGVLCADRSAALGQAAARKGSRSGHPVEGSTRRFDGRDQALLDGTARQIVRVIQAERVFTAVERSKYELERFYNSSALLNRALTPDEVFAMAFSAAREIGELDFAAITRFDRDTGRHQIAATSGDAAGTVAGTEFADNASLVSMVIKNRHYLPAGGELRDKDIPVFTRQIKLKGIESILVLPLICADEAIGTFTVASARPRFFGKDKREMLGVIANQVAVSVKNAELYRAMETMATTDGLTGLFNHRTFQERMSDLLGRAERQSGRIAFLLTDVDHFKKVNDTYGHPTGDQVLKRVAAVCRQQVRKIDVAARYGGEEFAIILDGTDLGGARQLAERIRTEVEKQQFTSDKGPFRCTLSLGIAAYPDDGRDAKTLIAHADQALYHAKRSGRNRAVAYADLQTKPRMTAVSLRQPGTRGVPARSQTPSMSEARCASGRGIAEGGNRRRIYRRTGGYPAGGYPLVTQLALPRSRSTACAAARRAIGTRKGEQLT
jgi:two-component system cell cycle response regulator